MGQRKIGLVLGGGGARGFSHIGVLKVLEEYRLPVHCVVGTSFGAIVGAFYAAGVSPAQMEAETARVDWRWLGGLLDVTLPGAGLLKGLKLEQYLDRLLQGNTFASLRLPLAVTATDLDRGEGVALQEGPVARAVRASAALPGIFSPVEIAGRRLLDGGLVKLLPVEEAFHDGADVVIAVDVSEPGAKVSSLEDICRWLPGRGQLAAVIRRCRDIIRSHRKESISFPGDRVIIIRPQMEARWYHFHHARECLRSGEIAAREAWSQLRALAAGMG